MSIDFKYFFGYTHADVKEHTKTVARMAPLMPRDRVNNVFVYEREDDFRIGLEAYYYGRQGLTDGNMARDFWIFGLMMEKTIDEDFSVDAKIAIVMNLHSFVSRAPPGMRP